MAEFSLISYTPDWAERWDRFITEGSKNGTFLQTRRFLCYHPADRFQDTSLMIAAENHELLAVIPAARSEADGELRFRAHPGSTFGGIVLSKQITQAKRTLEIVDALDQFLSRSTPPAS